MSHKTILVIGGTDGMGAATVHQCAERGCQVIFVGRSQDKADGLIAELSQAGYLTPVFYTADVGQTQSFINILEQIIHDYPRIDGVFCCAGKHIVGSITDTTVEQRDEIFRINVTSVVVTLQQVLPTMQKQNNGRVVIMCSDQSLVGKALSSAYGASKGALGQLVKSTAIDYASCNICVNGVCPGTIDTNQARNAAQHFAEIKFQGDFTHARDDFTHAQPIQRLGTPQEVAKLVAFLLLDNDGYLTGSLYSIDGGLTAM